MMVVRLYSQEWCLFFASTQQRVLCEVEHGEQQEKLRLSASGAIYVAVADVNIAPRQDGRAVAIKSERLDGIIFLRSRLVSRLLSFARNQVVGWHW